MVTPFTIGDKEIGSTRCYFIAEAGVNHNGSVEVAHHLVDAAADAGADAIKFQTFRPELLARSDARKAEYQERSGISHATQLEMLQALTLPAEAFAELQSHAEERAITFLSTPFDPPSAELLMELGTPALKVSSGELTNHPFLAFLCSAGVPLLISTGMAEMREVDAAVEVVRSASKVPPFALLHCVSAYPAPPADCNLKAMDTMRSRFNVPIGWSDHVRDSVVALAAVARGADVVEKHFTMSRCAEGPDHATSLEPGELAYLVSQVRTIESAMGNGEKRPASSEHDAASVARRGLYAARALRSGAVLGSDDVVAMRPASAFSPADLPRMIGRRIRHDVSAGVALTPDVFAE